MLARCLVPLPLPPTPSPLSWLLFRLHHLLSYPYQACTSPRRNLSSSHSGIVVSLSLFLFISPSPREEKSHGVFFFLFFAHHFFFLLLFFLRAGEQRSLAFLLASFVRFLLYPDESTDHSSLFLHGGYSVFLFRETASPAAPFTVIPTAPSSHSSPSSPSRFVPSRCPSLGMKRKRDLGTGSFLPLLPFFL